MIDINLSEMIAAAQPSIEDESEKIAFEKIPGPPIKGLTSKPEADVGDSEQTGAGETPEGE
jgi:hypothetical protein